MAHLEDSQIIGHKWNDFVEGMARLRALTKEEKQNMEEDMDKKNPGYRHRITEMGTISVGCPLFITPLL